MKKDVNKMLKRILVFLMFFMCINTANAKSNFTISSGTDLYKNCNEDTKCIPLCVYSSNEEEFDKEANNGEAAYIGYYYLNNFDWELGLISYDTFVYSRSTILPATDIYWSDYDDYEDEKQIPWNKVSVVSADGQSYFKPYDKLKDNFECPKYLSMDSASAGKIEVCLSNEKGTCKNQNKIGTKFKTDRELVSNFSDDVKKVIDDTYNELYIFGADSNNIAYVDPHVDKKINFLLEADSSFRTNYDANISGQDNIKNYCSILAENLKDEDKYFSSLTSNVVDYRETLNKQLQESATRLEVRNREVYTDETLSSLLTIIDSSGNKKYRKIIDDATGQTYIEKLHSLYAQNTIKSLNYARDLCNTIPGNNISYDETKLKNMLTNHYETTVYENLKLDLDTQFDCGTLGELADLVKTGYFIIEIVALVILIVFTVLDYAKVILSGEQDEMKKTNKRLKTRLIIMIVILLLPALINFILGVFNIEGFNSENPLCVEIKNK